MDIPFVSLPIWFQNQNIHLFFLWRTHKNSAQTELIYSAFTLWTLPLCFQHSVTQKIKKKRKDDLPLHGALTEMFLSWHSGGKGCAYVVGCGLNVKFRRVWSDEWVYTCTLTYKHTYTRKKGLTSYFLLFTLIFYSFYTQENDLKKVTASFISWKSEVNLVAGSFQIWFQCHYVILQIEKTSWWFRRCIFNSWRMLAFLIFCIKCQCF